VEVEDLIPDAPSPSSRGTETALFRRWRDDLRDDSGQTYAEMKERLVPRYGRVWGQLAIAYLALVATAWGMIALQAHLWAWWQAGVAGLPGGMLVGYLVAFIALWLHEAAHFNVHADRVWNDRLANIFLGPLVLHDVRQYRRIHFGHHKYLGTTNDTERSYFDALNARYFVESLTGIKPLRVLLTRVPGTSSGNGKSEARESYLNWATPAGILLHLGVIAGGIYAQQYALAVTWLFGVFIVYPFLGGLRQVLEHRKPDAEPSVDYAREPHGEYTRVFRGGVFSRTFGGAGFNRHLIHHWDPGISCTCFADVERFLERSQLGDFYASRTTTYREALRTLLQQSSRETLASAG
jgi:fatty acid desaturase